MNRPAIGILHPGKMGQALARTACNSRASSDSDVYWASAGRSPASHARAQQLGLKDAGSLNAMASTCGVIVSVCPPANAEELAGCVIAAGFRGTFLDANAVAPAAKHRMAERMGAAGIEFVDGGIIGFPSEKRGDTWLCLSGAKAREVAELLTGGPMEMDVIGPEVGQASALKMCFSAWSKGSAALLLTLMGSARQLGVLEDLKRYWSRRGPDIEWVEREILRAAPKAWRFAPEMLEIAATLESAGMPGGALRAADQVYQRLADFKDREGLTLAEVLELASANSED